MSAAELLIALGRQARENQITFVGEQPRGSFWRTKEAARINEVAYINRDRPDFSIKIRDGDRARLARQPSEPQ